MFTCEFGHFSAAPRKSRAKKPPARTAPDGTALPVDSGTGAPPAALMDPTVAPPGTPLDPTKVRGLGLQFCR